MLALGVGISLGLVLRSSSITWTERFVTKMSSSDIQLCRTWRRFSVSRVRRKGPASRGVSIRPRIGDSRGLLQPAYGCASWRSRTRFNCFRSPARTRAKADLFTAASRSTLLLSTSWATSRGECIQLWALRACNAEWISRPGPSSGRSGTRMSMPLEKRSTGCG